MPTIDLNNSYTLLSIMKTVTPVPGFFRDRYFPTTPADMFNSDKVLTEYAKDDRKMAAFVAPVVGDIPVERDGYEIYEFTPAKIAPSRTLTVDDLNKKGFGEALYANESADTRAVKITQQDMSDLDARIARREEWMCVQTMLNNRCDIQEMIDGEKQGQLKTVMFYNGTSDHTYGVNNNWGTSGADAYGDVVNMANMLADNGREASDLILGTDAWAKLRVDTNIREMLKTDSGIKIGEIAAEIVAKYPGVVYVGTLNFEGHSLNIFVVRESYTDEAGVTQRYFPANKAMVTAPACGHLAYGKVVQIDHGATQFSEYVNKRVPKLVVEQGDDIRKVRVTARPLAMPKNYCPYIVATVC